MKRSSIKVLAVAGLVAGTLLVALSPGDAAVTRVRLWDHQLGTSGEDRVLGVAAASHGTYVGGFTHAQLPGQIYGGGSDAFVARYANNGAPAWVQQFGGAGNESIVDVAAAWDGIVAVGTLPGPDVRVRRYSKSGEVLWTDDFGTAAQDGVNRVAVTDEGIYVVGGTYGALQPNSANIGYQDVYLRKYHPDGTVAWTKQYGTTNTDNVFGVAVGGGAVYLAISTSAAWPGGGGYLGDDSDAVLMKVGTGGVTQWAREIGTAAADTAQAVATDGTRVFLTGWTYGTFANNTNQGGADAYVAAYSPAGAQLWLHEFGTAGNDLPTSAVIAPPGVVVAGGTLGALPDFINAGSYDVFMQGYTPGGAADWTQQLGTGAEEQATDVDYSRFGVILGGYTFGDLFGPNLGSADGFVTRFVRYRPDAYAYYGQHAIVGNNVYSPTSQVLSGSVRRGDNKIFFVFADNDGESIDRLRLKGCSNPAGLTVRYFRSSTDITAEVKAGTYVTPKLPPGAVKQYEMRVSASANAALTTHDCAFTVGSSASLATKDTVTVRIKVVN